MTKINFPNPQFDFKLFKQKFFEKTVKINFFKLQKITIIYTKTLIKRSKSGSQIPFSSLRKVDLLVKSQTEKLSTKTKEESRKIPQQKKPFT